MDLKKYSKNKDLISTDLVITFTVIVLCMVLFSFFPTRDSFQKVVLSLVFLFLVPYLYIRVVLKDKLKNFGFNFNKWIGGFWIMPICFILAGGFFYLVFNYTDFKESYYLGKYKLIKNFWYLFFYEFLLVNLFVLLYEFFFRGFIMFYFEKKFGFYTVFVQFLFFILFLDILELLNLDYIFYVFTALLAGLIAYKSRSLVYSYFFSIIVLVVADLIYLKLVQ